MKKYNVPVTDIQFITPSCFTCQSMSLNDGEQPNGQLAPERKPVW